MKLSSPNLNYLIGAGAIVLYINIYTSVIPTTSISSLCNVSTYTKLYIVLC